MGVAMSSNAKAMMELFSGMEEAHGEYIIDEDQSSDKKKKEGRAQTMRQPVTEALWAAHLSGEKTLGIIPIRSDSTCYWGAIDIDDYSLDLKTFAIRVYKKELPLIPFRSKSGGCHLVVFFKEPVPAATVQSKLGEIAAMLGFGRSEIFPKQTRVMIEKGDLGNWLNMPYFGEDKGTRYALDEKGESLTIAELLKKAKKARLTEKQFIKIKAVESEGYLPDGPPCLQALVEQGFPQGTRNNGLFALGVYCRMAYPDSWERELEELNAKCMDPPLESKEVQVIIKQVAKKDYNYKCNDQPIASFCNASVCRTRAYGIGGGAMPTMQGLRKLPTDQPVWFLEVNSVTLELTTEQLQIQPKFQKACMDFINYMPPKVSERAWQTLIQGLLDNCLVLEKPPEAGISDQFVDLLATFCADGRLRANSKEELLLGRPWAGADPNNDDLVKVFFRLRDLEEYLVRNGFKYYNRSQIISRLTNGQINAVSHFFKIKGKGVNVWYMAEPEVINGPFELPEMGKDVL